MNREDALLDKAYKNSRKFADENGYGFMEPSMGNSGCEKHEGNEYVVLRNTTEILSVWLVENGDKISPVDDEDLPESLQEELSYCNA